MSGCTGSDHRPERLQRIVVRGLPCAPTHQLNWVDQLAEAELCPAQQWQAAFRQELKGSQQSDSTRLRALEKSLESSPAVLVE